MHYTSDPIIYFQPVHVSLKKKLNMVPTNRISQNKMF